MKSIEIDLKSVISDKYLMPKNMLSAYLEQINLAMPANKIGRQRADLARIFNGIYLVCLIDVFSRKIMGWNLSTFLGTCSCEQALHNALLNNKPEIINSDQGCQFTSERWALCLIINDIQVSMDGKGRWADNAHVERLWKTIKYESVFLHSFDTVKEAQNTLAEYIEFYSNERPHQALDYHTSSVIHDLNKIPSKQALFDSFSNLNRKDVCMIPKLA